MKVLMPAAKPLNKLRMTVFHSQNQKQICKYAAVIRKKREMDLRAIIIMIYELLV